MLYAHSQCCSSTVPQLWPQGPAPERATTPSLQPFRPAGWSKECCLECESVPGTSVVLGYWLDLIWKGFSKQNDSMIQSEEMDDDAPCNSALCCMVSQLWWGCSATSCVYAGQLCSCTGMLLQVLGARQHTLRSCSTFLSNLQSSLSKERKKS